MFTDHVTSLVSAASGDSVLLEFRHPVGRFALRGRPGTEQEVRFVI